MEKNYHLYAQKEMQIAAMVGLAMSRWANLKHALLQLFSVATSMPPVSAARFLAPIKTFSLSLDLTHAALKERLAGHPELVFCNSLIDYIRELSGDRNFIAHTAIVAHGPGSPTTVDWAKAEPKIGPAVGAYLLGIEKIPPMSIADVVEIREDIQEAGGLVIDFFLALESGKPLPQKYHKPVSRRRPPRKERLVAGRKKSKSPPKPSRG